MNEGKRQRSIFDFTHSRVARSDASLEFVTVTCPVCNYDITKFAVESRNAHVDACLVNPPSSKPVSKPASSSKSASSSKPSSPRKRVKVETVVVDEVVKEVVDVVNEVIEIDPPGETRSAVKEEFRAVMEKSVMEKSVSEPGARTTAMAKSLSDPVVKPSKPPKPKKAAKPARPESKYKNSAVTAEQAEARATAVKQIRPPATVRPSNTRNGIPPVKIMTFPVDVSRQYQIAVDAFSFAPHATIDTYLLTHFHADHYGGISKKWSYERCFGPEGDYSDVARYRKIIYCTTVTAKLLTLRFSVDERFMQPLEMDTRYQMRRFTPERVVDTSVESEEPEEAVKSEPAVKSEMVSEPLVKMEDDAVVGSTSTAPGLYVTPISANHCPGAGIFLFESISVNGHRHYYLHCGDFRVCRAMIDHPALAPFARGEKKLDQVYLDTTYMSPEYTFPKQETVCDVTATLFQRLSTDSAMVAELFGTSQSRITDMLLRGRKKKKILVLVGTYLIGKERLAVAISKRLKCPIYVSNIHSRDDKPAIIRSYGDPYLDEVITASDDIGANSASPVVVHLVPMPIVGRISETCNYFNHNGYHKHFERCIGLRPTGWSFVSRGAKPDTSPYTLDRLLDTIHAKSPYGVEDLLRQTPKPRTAASKRANPEDHTFRIYQVPYSEHSSFRELAFFVIFLNIKEVIPTVNEGMRDKMDSIIKVWELARLIRTLPPSEACEMTGASPSVVQELDAVTLDDF
ncbi:hypothetical protein DICA4_C06722 [Diutina catenulata]